MGQILSIIWHSRIAYIVYSTTLHDKENNNEREIRIYRGEDGKDYAEISK